MLDGVTHGESSVATSTFGDMVFPFAGEVWVTLPGGPGGR